MHEFLELAIVYVTFVFDAVGVILVAWGGIMAAVAFIWKEFKGRDNKSDTKLENLYRRNFATKMILGLEFFLAVDIIRTVVSPTWDALGKLAALVVIRTVLTYFLNKEIKESE